MHEKNQAPQGRCLVGASSGEKKMEMEIAVRDVDGEWNGRAGCIYEGEGAQG